MLSEVRRLCGHASTGPSGVPDQSTSRMRAASSPSPAKTRSRSSSVRRGQGRFGAKSTRGRMLKIDLRGPWFAGGGAQLLEPRERHRGGLERVDDDPVADEGREGQHYQERRDLRRARTHVAVCRARRAAEGRFSEEHRSAAARVHPACQRPRAQRLHGSCAPDRPTHLAAARSLLSRRPGRLTPPLRAGMPVAERHVRVGAPHASHGPGVVSMSNHPTRPEMPAARDPAVAQERSAIYRRRTVSRPPDPLAQLVEEVLTRQDDPRREP